METEVGRDPWRKEVKRVRGGERGGVVRMKGEDGELVRDGSELKGYGRVILNS